jgi:hypothetical protein
MIKKAALLDPASKLRVVIIRHGEKPSRGNNLCPKGLNRALQLPDVLYKVAGIPNHTYIPKVKTGANTSGMRMLQTITPFAVKYNLTLNSTYKDSEPVPAATEIKNKSGVVLVVWDHTNIPAMARALGAKGVPKWHKTDFDSIWIVEFTKGAAQPSFSIQSENIHPKGACQ